MDRQPTQARETSGTFDFIGAFVALRGDRPREEIRAAVRDFIRLPPAEDWKRLTFDPRSGGKVRKKFSPRAFSEVLDMVEEGTLLTMFLKSSEDTGNWWRDYEHPTFSATFQFEHGHPLGRRSPLPPGCAFLMTYPVGLFEKNRESSFQSVLLQHLAAFFVQWRPSYAFINRGRRARRPLSIGEDDIFYQTRTGIPLSSFDPSTMVLLEDLYEDRVRSAFWANFLNRRHVDLLGGYEALERVPRHALHPLPPGGVVVVLTPSPLDDTAEAESRYQAFREFVRPIRVETIAEWNAVSIRARGGKQGQTG